MKKITGKKAVLLGCAFSAFTIISCNSNNETTETTETDTTSVMQLDTTTPVMTDTMNRMDTLGSNVTGRAVPNPAKKGRKGKVTIVPATARADARMEKDASGVYSNVEVMPAFPGGSAALQSYFSDNLMYPADAAGEGVEGTVNVAFMVDEKGKLSDAKVVGERQGYGLDQEALRVVNKMPDWTPGKRKGENVKTKFVLPVRFELE